MSEIRMSLDEVRARALGVLERHGFDAANAEAIADNMTRAEASESRSHGLFRLPGHVKAVEAGLVNPEAAPRLERLAPAVLQVDADRGFAPLAQRVGLGPLAETARAEGLAALAITRTMHLAALWPEVETLAEAGLVAMAFTSTPAYMAAGGRRRIFGTNPMAFGWPRAEAAPMVWDQASAAMARGEIMIAARDGHALPEGAGVDAEGRPSTDPEAVLEGAQLPFGGYKGAAIALMVDLLAGPLIGELTSLEATESAPPPGLTAVAGELIMAIDPARFGAAGDPRRHGETVLSALESEPGTRLPGARRISARARTARDGVTIGSDLDARIRALEGQG